MLKYGNAIKGCIAALRAYPGASESLFAFIGFYCASHFAFRCQVDCLTSLRGCFAVQSTSATWIAGQSAILRVRRLQSSAKCKASRKNKC